MPSSRAAWPSIGLHPPKPAMDIPVQFAEAYFDLMPIHEKLRRGDFPTIRNYLRVTMCNIHDELTSRMDAPALAGMAAQAARLTGGAVTRGPRALRDDHRC